MKLAIMQPYLFPYIGYWQLINAVDKFVVYDNIQFEKNGWMRRNRILVNGQVKMFTIPIQKASDFLDVNERILSAGYLEEAKKILRMIKNSYGKAPYFGDVFPVLEECFLYENLNLFSYIYNSIQKVCAYLDIHTEIVVSSELKMDHELKGKQRVMATCHFMGADTYINPIGGMELYKKEEFRESGIDLRFLKADLTAYKQISEGFVQGLSIIDLMMMLSKTELRKQLTEYKFYT